MRPAWRQILALLGTAALLLALSATSANARPTQPARPAQSTSYVTLNGVQYVDAIAFGKRFGLKATWTAPQKRLVLSSRYTRIEFEVDSRDIRVNGARIFMGDGARYHGRTLRISRIDAEKLLTPILRPGLGQPTMRSVKTIVLDAGHGGRDPGMENKRLNLQEKTLALDVVRRIEKILTNEGYRVILTRKDDRFIELGERPAVATRARADVFVSVHFNAVESNVEKVSGTETYIMTPQFQRSAADNSRGPSDGIANPGNENDHWNSVLGYHLHRSLVNQLKTSDRGLKRGRLAVLRLSTCPAVLVEAGFVTNTAEARKIATAAYRQQIAEAVAAGVKQYAAAVERSRSQ